MEKSRQYEDPIQSIKIVISDANKEREKADQEARKKIKRE